MNNIKKCAKNHKFTKKNWQHSIPGTADWSCLFTALTDTEATIKLSLAYWSHHINETDELI